MVLCVDVVHLFISQAQDMKRLTSPAVFGNGRTHTGELCGSGGSRLANYGLGGMLSSGHNTMLYKPQLIGTMASTYCLQ